MAEMAIRGSNLSRLADRPTAAQLSDRSRIGGHTPHGNQ
jgi:hypothetical protein